MVMNNILNIPCPCPCPCPCPPAPVKGKVQVFYINPRFGGNKIPCPPAPRYGYTMCFDNDAQQWIFIKK